MIPGTGARLRAGCLNMTNNMGTGGAGATAWRTRSGRGLLWRRPSPFMMLNENTVQAARKFLEENPEEAAKVGQIKSTRIGANLICRFLGWDVHRVNDALKRLGLVDDGLIKPTIGASIIARFLGWNINRVGDLSKLKDDCRIGRSSISRFQGRTGSKKGWYNYTDLGLKTDCMEVEK